MYDCACENCCHCHFYKGKVRGIMDADPDEWDCSKGEDNFFFTEWKEEECPHYSPVANWSYWPDDDGDRRYDELRELNF